MKIFEAIANGVSDAVKASFRGKKIMRSLETAKLNAQEQLECAKAELEEAPVKCMDKEPDDVIRYFNDLEQKFEDAEATLARLAKIEARLNGEMPESK